MVDPRRPASAYALSCSELYASMGAPFAEATLPAVLRVIFRLKNLRRAEDPAGHMAQFMLNQFGTDNKMYIDNTGNFSPWPGSLTVIVSGSPLFWCMMCGK